MGQTPLEFEREFARLKSRLNASPDSTAGFVSLIHFWPDLSPLTDKRQYDSHTEEYLALLLEHCQPASLRDLPPGHLRPASAVLGQMAPVADRFGQLGALQAAREKVVAEWARKLMYAGDAHVGLAVLLSKQTPPGNSPADHLSPSLDEFETACRLCKDGDHADSRQVMWLASFLADWELAREGTSRDFVYALFVDKTNRRSGTLGRLRELTCSAEFRPTTSTQNEVTFENQIRSPDDPFVGAIHTALTAAGAELHRSGLGRGEDRHVHAHFAINDSTHAFTGDSIGLAAAVVTFVQLLSDRVLRRERLVALDAAFTGSIEADGRVGAVSDQTIDAKVQRVFFSPVRYLVLPEVNLSAAERAISKLRRDHPRRRLQLIPVTWLSDLMRNRNAIREEKICVGEYVVRKAYDYGRLAKIQIPLLLALVYVLLCLVYPKAWLGFDSEPAHVWLDDPRDRVVVANRDSVELWHMSIGCAPLASFLGQAADLDGDSHREVLWLGSTSELERCPKNDVLHVLDADGNLLFTRQTQIFDQYPGDSVEGIYYRPTILRILDTEKGRIIATNVVQHHPARSHLRVWSADGDPLGWYIHAGHIVSLISHDLDSDGHYELIGIGINNRARGMGLFVIPPEGCYGASPPYEDSAIDLSGVVHGNQSSYVVFPTGDLTLIDSIPYDNFADVAVEPGNSLRVDIVSKPGCWRSFYLDSSLHVTRVLPDDPYWADRQTLVAAGLLPKITFRAYCERELAAVRYWHNGRFVSQADLDTMR